MERLGTNPYFISWEVVLFTDNHGRLFWLGMRKFLVALPEREDGTPGIDWMGFLISERMYKKKVA